MAGGRKSCFSEEDLELAVEAVVDGLSYRAAEKMAGVPVSALRKYIVG
jgi:hypothetical protein